jgi:hypothetical protein
MLDYSRARAIVFTSLYSPWALWPLLAEALADLGGPKRDPELMYRLTEMPTFKCTCGGTCDDKDRHEQDFEALVQDAQAAILCSDGLEVPSDLASAKGYFNKLSKDSEWADIWGNIRLGCTGWPKAKKGFQGPVGGNTSFPLLFIGNTAGKYLGFLYLSHLVLMFSGFTSRYLQFQDPVTPVAQ